jgi:glycosyltransferase involved in cell wall biosynthesis
VFVPGKKSFRIENRSKNLRIVKVPSFQFHQYKGYRVPKLQLKKISRIMEKEKFDIIHIHTPFTLGLVGIAMSRLYSIPIVGTYHTYLPEYFPHIVKGRFHEVMKKIGGFPIKKFTKYVYSKLDCTIAPSEETARILKNLEIKNVTVIPNGIKLERFRYQKKSIEKIRKKYKIPRGKKILLYLGRISFEKKLSILLKAFKILENEGEDVFLLIAGSGPYIEKYKKEAKQLELKNIQFTGFVKDELIPAIYHTSNIFVSPSDTEVGPITFIEAMACGLPLIGVNSGGVRNIVQHGKNGLLARPKDPVSLALKIKTLLDKEELMKKMRKINRDIVKEYSIESTTKKLLNLYRRKKVRKKKPHPFFKVVDLFLHPEVVKQKISEKILTANKNIKTQLRRNPSKNYIGT